MWHEFPLFDSQRQVPTQMRGKNPPPRGNSFWTLSILLFSPPPPLQPTPPEYHVEDLTVNVALFWGDNDRLADPTDVGKLIPRIPKLIYNKEISNFEHLDFIWAMDAKSILYDDIITIMRGNVTRHWMRDTGGSSSKPIQAQLPW